MSLDWWHASAFLPGLVNAVLLSAVCGPLGVFLLLRRSVFVAAALAETAVFGAALATRLGLPVTLGAGPLSLLVAVLMGRPWQRRRLPQDGIVALIFVAASAASVLLVAADGPGLRELQALLQGEILLAGSSDLLETLTALVPVSLLFLLFLRRLELVFTDRDFGRTRGLDAAFWETLLFLALGWVVAVGSRTAGPWPVFVWLVAPGLVALGRARSFAQALAWAALFAVVTTVSGFLLALAADLPVSQTVSLVVAVPVLPMLLLRPGGLEFPRRRPYSS